MAFYYIMFNGKNLNLKSDNSVIIGFHNSRKVWANSAEQAIERAKKSIFQEWKNGKYLEQNGGKFPDLFPEIVEEYLKFWQGLIAKVPQKGFTFYSKK